MRLTTESERHVKHVAGETLSQLEGISAAAKHKLQSLQTPGPDVFANVNTMTFSQSIQKLGQIGRVNRESYQLLAGEPAIARVVVVNKEGGRTTYYICRTTPISGFMNLASYRAPVGRLASLAVGDEFTLPNGVIVEVMERAQLRPTELADGWDCRDTVLEGEHFGPLTIASLRILLTQVSSEDVTEDLLGQLLAEETVKSNLIDGIRRSVITKMGLRDQPILDKYQDEIFRLPLDKRVLLLGPPGTGKTTTLIRRLGQKLDTDLMEEGEKHLVEMIASTQGTTHANSWLMFTPSELLKQYLKEAFAREEVPASDLRIRTWQDYRRELARNVFGVLRTASGNGLFILKDNLQNLRAEAFDHPTGWYDDFSTWQRNAFIQDLYEAANRLRDTRETEIQSLGDRLRNIVTRAADGALASIFESLAIELPTVQTLVVNLKEVSDSKIKAALNLQLNRNRLFLDELADFLDGLQQLEATDADEQAELDADEEEDSSVPLRAGRATAINAYMQAVRAQARAVASARTLNRSSRNGQIIHWLGERGLTEADRTEVGESLLVQANARRFMNPVKRYINGIPKRYRAYRRVRQQARNWYRDEGFEARDIHPLELDIVLLNILRAAGDLLSRPSVQRDIDSSPWSVLKPILEEYRNQVLVDEATDFSPIQLGCMAALTHPRLRSFFACGDFNQRLTTWGARSADEIKWVCSDFDIKEINVSYRQSKELNDLARTLIYAVSGTEQNVSLLGQVDSVGVKPALLEYAKDTATVVHWLANRIREIERFVGQLPSTAIFVNNEDQVEPLALTLNAALSEHNILVTACREGQTIGNENAVRIFNIQHIKGLEFEAVFFVGIDRLATMHPTLIEKFLYVGITRAATYLGMTSEDSLPPVIDHLRAHFSRDWQAPSA